MLRFMQLFKLRRVAVLKRISFLLIALLMILVTLQLSKHEKEALLERTRLDSKKNDPFNKDEVVANLIKQNSALSSVKKQEQCETVHICVLCTGTKSLQQIDVLIKSILFHRKFPLYFHLLVTETSKSILKVLFETWRLPDVKVSFYLTEDHDNKTSWINKQYVSPGKIHSLMTLVALEILPTEVTKVLVLDPALVFAADISELWNKFDSFNNEQSIGMAQEQSYLFPKVWRVDKKYVQLPALGNGFNTAVILLNCDRLRKWGWSSKWKAAMEPELNKLSEVTLNDQDAFNIVLKQNPSLIYTLPCKWNLLLSRAMKPELCYAENSGDFKAIYIETGSLDEKIKRRYPLLNSFHQSMAEIDGDLLRLPSSSCSNKQGKKYHSDSNMFYSRRYASCKQFGSGSSYLYRTHLYYLPFEYTSKTSYDVSIVVHLSYDRLTMLEKICRHWKGPISAAILITDYQVQRMISFVKDSKVLKNRQNIGYHLAFKQSDTSAYLTNILRNIALSNAVTEYVLLYDVDFAPMPRLDEYIVSYLSTADVSGKHAFVVPAFESYLYKFKMPETKSDLVKDLASGAVTTFHSYTWLPGHKPTDFERWLATDNAYNIEWAPEFEPYVVVKRKSCPDYDTRFSGFGWNKISHIMELDAAGFTFTVLPFAFVIHMPHSPSQDHVKYMTEGDKYRKCASILKSDFVKKLLKKYGPTRKYNYAKFG